MELGLASGSGDRQAGEAVVQLELAPLWAAGRTGSEPLPLNSTMISHATSAQPQPPLPPKWKVYAPVAIPLSIFHCRSTRVTKAVSVP